MKNIFGYFVGVLLFLVFFPALMYAVAVNFVVPVDSLIVSTVGAIFVLIGAVFMVWSNIDMVKIGRGCPTDGFNIALGERTKKLIVQGPYKYTRNPMLFGTFVFYVGLALLFNSYSALKNLKNPDYITISKTNMLNIKKEPRYCFQNLENKGRNK